MMKQVKTKEVYDVIHVAKYSFVGKKTQLGTAIEVPVTLYRTYCGRAVEYCDIDHPAFGIVDCDVCYAAVVYEELDYRQGGTQ